MKINVTNIITLFILQFFIVFFAKNTKADTFGESCTTLPVIDASNYLTNYTAYGFIQKTLDMKTHIQGACDVKGDEFNFCIRNDPDADIWCEPVAMQLGDKVALNTLTTNPNIINYPSLAAITLTVEIMKEKLCLTMPTSRGNMPLMCRNYAAEDKPKEEQETISTCSTIGMACYNGGTKSQSVLNFSGLTIECLRDTLNKVFYIGNDCHATGHSTELTSLKPFPEFQGILKLAVMASLTIYTIIFGFKIIMNNEYAQLNKIALFVIKIILVLYFAVGLGGKKIEQGKEIQQNGMTELVLPLLVDTTSKFAQYIFLAAGSQGLCSFDESKYQRGYEFYKLWDAIDCRLGSYLGLQLEPMPGNAIIGDQNVGTLTFFPLMFCFWMSGQLAIMLMGIVVCCVLMSVFMYFISAYLVSMVTLYAMAYISPIFIPMVLFNRTKAYFDSWVKILVSCTLQPMVIGGFIALLLTMYDNAFYGNCEFKRNDSSAMGKNYSTFTLSLPINEQEQCKASFGYKFQQYIALEDIEQRALMLFVAPKLNDFLDIFSSLLYLTIYLVIFYFFVKSINEFSSALVGGPSLSGVTMDPNAVQNKAGKYAAIAQTFAAAGMKAKTGDMKGAARDAKKAAGELQKR